MGFYDFAVQDTTGKNISLSEYHGKVLLIVNTATHCGFTPQYKGLQELYDAYREKGFEILDFPCNQFGKQAPGSAEEISSFCTLQYHTTFKQFAKIEVNGTGEIPLYTFLKSEQKGVLGSNIKWNFTKFLIDKQGNVVNRYGPDKKPEIIKADIEKLLVI
ncbi:glutathione peroxidase [Spirochaetia bacterium]|nr:glutathione peroxidase [Spirochaetia bacterium]GHU32679.1 glutathione peroxidase [Spirochaetia bacterium]